MDFSFIINHMLTFILTLYADSKLPRNIVQSVIDNMNKFIRDAYLPSIKNDIFNALEKENISEFSLKNIENCFEKHINIFECIETEAKRFSLLKKKGLIKFEEFSIGKNFENKLIGNKMLLCPEEAFGIHVPLRKTLKLFLEIPGVFEETIEYIENLNKESYIISNIIQADLWIKKYKHLTKNEIVLPLFIFFDELEVGNALGSHAGINKFGAVYASIACLPPRFASQLKTIILALLVHSNDLKQFGNKNVFTKIINELNFLRNEGISINLNGKIEKVKFQLVLILGDNLGLNSIFGFVESFKCDFFCRICKVTQQQSSIMCKEDEKILRSKSSYEKDIKVIDVSNTGIKQPCIFHEIQDFHLTENVTVDMMHDVLEGVCMYVLQFIMYHYLFTKEYFTLQHLNSRIQNFHFGPIEIANKPPVITMNRIKKKLNLKMSASEMLCLFRYFGLIVADLISEDDEHWQLYKYLRQIVDIVTSPKIVGQDATYLKEIIENHHKLYVKLNGKLKPKFHYLLHYPRILLNNGPSIHFWSMRFESRHRQIKASAQASSCTKNLLVTIATKEMLKMCAMFHSAEMESSITFGSLDKRNKSREYMTVLNKSVTYYNWIEINGNILKIGMFVVTSVMNIEKEFGEIEDILKINEDVYLYLCIFDEITFDEHYHAYIVTRTKKRKLIKFNDLPELAAVLFAYKNGTHFIATRYRL